MKTVPPLSLTRQGNGLTIKKELERGQKAAFETLEIKWIRYYAKAVRIINNRTM